MGCYFAGDYPRSGQGMQAIFFPGLEHLTTLPRPLAEESVGNRRAKRTQVNDQDRRAKQTHPSRFCSTGDFAI